MLRRLALAQGPTTVNDGTSEGPAGTGVPSGTAFSDRERSILLAVAEAALPPGAFLPGASERTVRDVEAYFSGLPSEVRRAYAAALWAIQVEPLPKHFALFSSLDRPTRTAILTTWEQSSLYAVRTLLRLLLTPLKLVHFARPEMFAHVGCRYELDAVRDEVPRFMQRVTDGRTIDEDTELECEVVVVGTGAGGAAAAYELARRGRAVLLLEEGDFHRRGSFRGRSLDAYKNLYRDGGLTGSVGNVGIPIWAGRAVGGSTLVNAGTCYRTPERTLFAWREELGLPQDFSSEGLATYFERVESMLGVAEAPREHLGSIADIIARGASRLGLSHGPLRRNAPGCDGQGVCCFGCPTGAKRSTDVSYVPEALRAGAELWTAARVHKLDVVAGRVRGLVASLRRPAGRRDERAPELRIKADAVVVAAGALHTPLLLRRSGVCASSGQLGKNLSIHPATKIMALFDDRMDQSRGIPQGYSIDALSHEGILFEGSSLPLDVAALGVPWVGSPLIELMESYPHLATFGFMIRDSSRGEVRPGRGGSPRIFYSMNEADRALLQRGAATLIDVFQRAGARRVFPFLAGAPEVSTREALQRFSTLKLKPRDFELSAFHPLGTCRIGADGKTSCLKPNHEAWDTRGLYVVDGSAVPSSLGVNPQVTIMALALRAAEGIHAALG